MDNLAAIPAPHKSGPAGSGHVIPATIKLHLSDAFQLRVRVRESVGQPGRLLLESQLFRRRRGASPGAARYVPIRTAVCVPIELGEAWARAIRQAVQSAVRSQVWAPPTAGSPR
jgi:hypothetical protein